MNSLIFQMIAARAAGSGNTTLADMLARVRAANGGGGSPLNTNELLSQLGNNNPLLSALCKRLSEGRIDNSSGLAAPVIDVEPQTELHDSAKPNGHARPGESESLHELKEQLENLHAEIRLLRERCDLLAATLGACCLCWGKDPDCRACRGRGKPGFAIPDESLFGELVLPALRVLRAQKVKPSGMPGSPDVQNPVEVSAVQSS